MHPIIQKTREDYNKIAQHFSYTRQFLWPEMEHCEFLIKPKQNILDWGCGNGRLVYFLENKQVKYFGVDQSEELIKIGKKAFVKEIKDDWVKFFCTAKKQKKFSDNFFDVVFMFASFHHLPDVASRQALLKKVFSEIKVGGRLAMTVWNLESGWAEKQKGKGYKEFAPNDWFVPWKDKTGKVICERYYHSFTKDELKKLVEGAGFKIEELEYFDKLSGADKRSGRNILLIAKK